MGQNGLWPCRCCYQFYSSPCLIVHVSVVALLNRLEREMEFQEFQESLLNNNTFSYAPVAQYIQVHMFYKKDLHAHIAKISTLQVVKMGLTSQ